MNRRILSYSLVAAMLTTSVSFNALADKEDTGAIIGAIVGGVIGNQIGGGSGKKIATGLGIIVGAVVGAEVGRDMDENDRRALEEAQRDALRRPIGDRSDWDGNRYGSRTGARGHFKTTREGYLRSNSREVCREYESVIVTRSKTETRTGVACSRADGSWREVNSTEVVFRDGTVRTETTTTVRRPDLDRRPPVVVPGPSRPPVRPEPPVYRPEPNYPSNNYGSLQGYCSDRDHQQFYAAKNLAYSSSGLNLSSDQAVQWALRYNETHRCGTIEEYSARYRALYNLAYSTSGLNMSSQGAKEFALQRVETMNVDQVRQYQEVSVAVKNFVYSTNGLNKDSASAARASREWADRGYCGNADLVRSIAAQYSKEYNFAYSSSGLNMSSVGARDYAVNKISRMTRCSDLLR